MLLPQPLTTVKRRRLNLCYTQGGFAREFGISVATLRDWEQDRRTQRIQKMVEQAISDLEAKVERNISALETRAATPTGKVGAAPIYSIPNIRTPVYLGGGELYDPEDKVAPPID